MALHEELKADRDRYRDGYLGHEDVNGQLKQLIQDNQDAAEKLQDQIHRSVPFQTHIIVKFT